MPILGRSEELVSRCVECDLAEPESLSSRGGSAPGVFDGILSSLLGYLHLSSVMADGAILFDPVHPSRMAKSTSRRCDGTPPSTCKNAALHAAPARIQTQWDDEEDTYAQAAMQCVRPETGWPGVEQVHGPGHEQDRLHAKQV